MFFWKLSFHFIQIILRDICPLSSSAIDTDDGSDGSRVNYGYEGAFHYQLVG